MESTGNLANTGGPKATEGCTLYINNLNSKIRKAEIKMNLYFLFSQFGEVLDIVTQKSAKMRGQAFVVMSNPHNAAVAKKALQNFNMFDKELKVSDSIAIRDGTFQYQDRQQLAMNAAEARKKREEENKLRLKQRQLAPKKTNNFLLVENIPKKATEASLSLLFKEFPGFKDLQLGEKEGVLFAGVEYGSDAEATIAMKGLNGFKIDSDHTLKITYAKTE